MNYSPRAIRLYEKIKLNSELLYIFDKAINLSLAKLNKDFEVDNFLEKIYNEDNYVLWLNINKNFNFNNEDKQIMFFFLFWIRMISKGSCKHPKILGIMI